MGEEQGKHSKLHLLIAYLMLYIVWGSTYLAIRFSVETIPPLMSGGVRFLAAGAILFCLRFCLIRKFPSAHGWFLALRASMLPLVISYGLITAAETLVPSSIAALLIALEPLWYCLVGWLLFNRERPKKRHYLALLLGFAGICALIIGDPNAELSFDSAYTIWMLLLVLSGILWVTGAFISADPRIHSDSLTSSGMQMLCGGTVLIILQYILSSFTGNYPQFQALSVRSALALGYLVIFGSLVGYSAFLWLMRVEPASRVSTHAFVNPVIAVILGWLIGGEEIHANMLLALPLVIASVILMIYDGSHKHKSERE